MTPGLESPVTYVETNEQKREEEGNPVRDMR
jgi:hypothetical protein